MQRHGLVSAYAWRVARLHYHVFPVCSDIMGETADIHTGGVDLKFPHHDNEIAQAEVCEIRALIGALHLSINWSTAHEH